MLGSNQQRLLLAVSLAGLAAAIVLALAENQQQRRSGFEVALQDNAVFVARDYYDRELAFRQARSLGATWLRVTLLWSRAVAATASQRSAPAAVTYDWAPWDNIVKAAAAHGLHVEMTVTGPAPAWATSDRRIGVFRPDAARFAQFAGAAAAHFRARVERYSIWNEPNFATWLTPHADDARLYRALYVGAQAAIEAADPHAQILIGETAGPSQPGLVTPVLSFIRSVACVDANYRPTARCPRLVADGFAHHPYDFLNPPEHRFPSPEAVTIGSIDRLTQALDALGHAGALTDRAGRPLDIYLTEFGYFSSARGGPPEDVRASWLTRAFGIAAAQWPRVRQLLQYLLVNPSAGFPGGGFDTGIVSQSGVESPAYRALAAWARGAEADGTIARP